MGFVFLSFWISPERKGLHVSGVLRTRSHHMNIWVIDNKIYEYYKIKTFQIIRIYLEAAMFFFSEQNTQFKWKLQLFSITIFIKKKQNIKLFLWHTFVFFGARNISKFGLGVVIIFTSSCLKLYKCHFYEQ